MVTRIVQIGMCTADLPGSVRRYCDLFGFQDAGGRLMWGPRSAKVQELGDDANAIVWWAVGTQEFVNLEFFNHTLPPQRPLPADWLPSALGWVRWGIAVPDFGDAIARMRGAGLALSDIATIDGLRRICFRDPGIGVMIEVMEDGPGLPESQASGGLITAPRVVYATLSVPDLAAARAFYADAMEMEPVAAQLHSPEMEALWGLAGASRETLLLDGGGVFLELVRYSDPPGRVRTDLRLNDQGIMNIAFGYRERPALERAMQRARDGGSSSHAPLANTVPTATYIKDPFGNSIEMLHVPARLDVDYGWAPRPPAYR